MKKCLIFLYLLMLISVLMSLDFKVDSCELDVKDLHNATGKIVDADKQPCALLRVETDVKPELYLSGAKIVKREKIAPGQYYFFISAKDVYITFGAEGYTPYTYRIQVKLEAGRTYRVLLSSVDNTKTNELSVVFNTNPPEAKIFLDDKEAGLSGSVIKAVKGTHMLRVTLKDHKQLEKKITIDENNLFFSYNLEPLEPVLVNFTSEPAGAEINLDSNKIGETPYTAFLTPGKYNLKVTKPEYNDIKSMLEIKEGVENNYSYKLTQHWGYLNLSVLPADAKISIDGEDYSGTGKIRLGIGLHKIEMSKYGYAPKIEDIILTENKTTEKKYVLEQQYGSVSFKINQPLAETVIKQNGKILESWTGDKVFITLPVGAYVYEIRLKDHKIVKKEFVLEANQKYEQDIALVSQDPIPANFILVQGGTFQMGSTLGTKYEYEDPVHEVTLSSFYMDKYELTLRDYKLYAEINKELTGPEQNKWAFELMAYIRVESDWTWKNPNNRGGDNAPVTCLNFIDAARYCNWRSEAEGLEPCYTIDSLNVSWEVSANGYRLPTEAEWEYAAKGGKNQDNIEYNGKNKIDQAGWYYDNSENKIHDVGLKSPNSLGLYDMSGNAAEWCWDEFNYYTADKQTNPTGTKEFKIRIYRGGSWSDNLKSFRVSARRVMEYRKSGNYVGIRLVRNSN